MSRCNSRCCSRNSNSNCRSNNYSNMYNNYQNSNCNMCSNNCRSNDRSSVYSNICQDNNTRVFPENYLYGHAYTPIQTLNNTYIPEVGLQNGSIFPELVSPYSPGQSIDFIEFLRCGGRENG